MVLIIKENCCQKGGVGGLDSSLETHLLTSCYTLPNLSPFELEFQVEYQTQVGIPIWIRIQIGIPSWIVNPLGECTQTIFMAISRKHLNTTAYDTSFKGAPFIHVNPIWAAGSHGFFALLRVTPIFLGEPLLSCLLLFHNYLPPPQKYSGVVEGC